MAEIAIIGLVVFTGCSFFGGIAQLFTKRSRSNTGSDIRTDNFGNFTIIEYEFFIELPDTQDIEIKPKPDPKLGKCQENTICPITKEEIEDPYLLHTEAGLLYEKEVILKWLSIHPTKDPSTNIEYSQNLICSKYEYKKKELNDDKDHNLDNTSLAE